MGGKATSGSAYSPPRDPRPPERPSHPPLSRPHLLDQLRDVEWRQRMEEFFRTSPYVDYLYLVGLIAVAALAAYILAFG